MYFLKFHIHFLRESSIRQYLINAWVVDIWWSEKVWSILRFKLTINTRHRRSSKIRSAIHVLRIILRGIRFNILYFQFRENILDRINKLRFERSVDNCIQIHLQLLIIYLIYLFPFLFTQCLLDALLKINNEILIITNYFLIHTLSNAIFLWF